MNDFSKEIDNFKKLGNYVYMFDNNGNSIFNSNSENFNQVFISFPIKNINYIESKIKIIYNSEFEEFLPQPITDTTSIVDSLKQQLNVVQEENITLNAKIDSIISQGVAGTTEADQLATKQVILELRKLIGQGRVDSDFSTSFPYTPIKKPTS